MSTSPWRKHAECQGMDAREFIPRNPGQAPTAAAIAACGRCPVVEACLDYAVRAGESGYWGGKTEGARKAIARRLRVVPTLPDGDRRHGLNGYTNHGCRCDTCRAAARAQYARQRDRRAS